MADTDTFGEERRRIAERLFEVMRIPHSTPYHFRRRIKRWLEGDEYETLCGKTATVAIKIHPTEKPCTWCLTAAQSIVDDTLNEQFHAAINVEPNVAARAPLARPHEVAKRRGWMRKGKR